MAQRQRRDIYQEVSDQIIGYLEQGTVPWRNPIRHGTGDGFPKNLHSGKRYRGINVLLLAMQAWNSGYASDYWLTFKQARGRGGQVRKGQKGSLVTFWKMYETKDKETGEPATIPVLKHYTAFNVEQIEGIDIPDAPMDHPGAPFEPLQHAEAIVAGYADGPKIEHGGQIAYYRPSVDAIRIPKPDYFETGERYYATLFHELSHSTGHSRRLDRGLDTRLTSFGSPDYSREELVAEMSSAFLCASAGISPPTIEQSAAYIESWIGVLKGDKRLAVAAAGAGQKSADWILGETFNDVASDPEPQDPQQTPRQSRPLPVKSNDSSTRAPAEQLDLF